MKLIVGLGNPGPEYALTRHNAGFMAVERLAKRSHLTDNPVRAKFHSAMLEGPIVGERCVVLEPQTYMNRSGLAVAEAVTFYKLNPQTDLMVLVDDLALPVGRIRLRPEGSAGGHNGLADIQRALGTVTYPRLRIGIDPRGRVHQADYVLGRFSPDQLAKLGPALDGACDAVETWIQHGIDKAMTRHNADAAGA